MFDSSYHALSSDAATLFRLLGLAPGPDVGVVAAARLAARSTARALLRELERTHLPQQHSPGRYRMHDLVRVYAGELAQPADEASLLGLLDHLLHTALRADAAANPNHEPIPAQPPDSDAAPFRSPVDAMTWFDTEHRTLLAAQTLAAEHNRDDHVWQLAWALDGSLWRRGHLLHHVTAWQAGLHAAERRGDVVIQARAHRRLGHAWARAGRHTEAATHLNRALESGHGQATRSNRPPPTTCWRGRGTTGRRGRSTDPRRAHAAAVPRTRA